MAMAGLEVADRGFVDLHIAARQHVAADRLINQPQPIGGDADPLAHRLAGEGHAVPAPVDDFLPARAGGDRQYLATRICATRPGVAMLLSRRQGGSGAMMGTASSSPRRTYFGRTVRWQRKRAGS